MISSRARTSQQAVEKGTHEDHLTETRARFLLFERGYELVERVQHIHASCDGQEWYSCLLANLPLLTPEQFQHRFKKALSFRISSS